MKNREPKYLELQIESMAFEGVAIGRHDNKVYFIKNAVPGDYVKAQIFKSKKNFAEGVVYEIINKSDNRIEPECKYFGVCGGCSWQNLSYEEQLKWKTINVKDSFERIGKFDNFNLQPIIASGQQFHFRNKMEFTFGANRWLTQKEIESMQDIQNKDFALGLHPLGRYDKILDLEYCKIQNDYADNLLNYIKVNALKFGLDAYNVRTFNGFLRNLIIRHSATYNNFMIILITNDVINENEAAFITQLNENIPKLFPKIVSFYHAINNSNNPIKISETNLKFGVEYLEEKIFDINFKISPFSFFQTNSYQLNTFIEKILSTIPINKDYLCWDLFCGTGSITLPLSQKCSKVIGIELSKSSINDANINKDYNNIDNVEFFQLDLGIKDIEEQLKNLPKPDILFLDPPRAGLNKNLIEFINNSDIKRIVYVSCNPATQARDCDLMKEYYQLISVQPVDMFPQTYHIENIALLELKK